MVKEGFLEEGILEVGFEGYVGVCLETKEGHSKLRKLQTKKQPLNLAA